MPTIQAKTNPQSRIDAGDHVLQSAKTVDTKEIKAKLAAFAKVHAEYSAAHRQCAAAEAKLDDAQAAVGEADGIQDAAVTVLAAKMIGDGAPKSNPLALFKLPPPSTLIVLAVDAEVKLTRKLAKLATQWKDASAPTKGAASKLDKAAAAVEKAMAKVAPLARAHAAAIAKRDALGVPWTRSFAHLKNAARVAEDDGARGLFAALFGVTPTRAAPRTPAARPPQSPPVVATPTDSAG